LVQEKKNMKRFRKFRDPRFVLTTLQNPSWEVRTRAELIQAAQDALTRQPDAAELPFAGRPAAPGTPPLAITIPPPAAAAPLAEPQPQPQEQPKSEPQPASQPNPLTESHAAPSIRPLPKTFAKHPSKRRPKPKSKLQPGRLPLPVHFSKIIPGGDAAVYVAESLDRHANKAAGPNRDESSALPDLKRHARKCAICHHPNRADLEEDFLDWRNADLIKKEFDLPNYHTIYRHARALGLYERRRENLRFAAELLIEHADQAQPDANAILRAIHACARINDRGEWVEPARRLIVTSASQLAATAPEFQLPLAPEAHQFAPQNDVHPQFSAPVSTSTDGVNPQFLINVPPIRK
jgi:hypothetical protein